MMMMMKLDQYGTVDDNGIGLRRGFGEVLDKHYMVFGFLEQGVFINVVRPLS